jgi:hypothetical protein
MKTLSIFLFISLVICFSAFAQTTRYFEFTISCGHGNWQDTSIIASATNQILIDTILAELNFPLSQRRFISGPIDYGNGGFNHNASHWFKWHFIPDQWVLTELAVEVCDGCPYTDLDSDAAYWVGQIGNFCPWSGQPAREVFITSINDEPDFADEILLYPNPANDEVIFKKLNSKVVSVTVFNSVGQKTGTIELTGTIQVFDVRHLQEGIYFLKFDGDDRSGFKKLVVGRKKH